MIRPWTTLRVPFTIAHLGMNKACNGTESRGFSRLLDLVKNGEGYAHLKLTAPTVYLSTPATPTLSPSHGPHSRQPRPAWNGKRYPHASLGTTTR